MEMRETGNKIGRGKRMRWYMVGELLTVLTREMVETRYEGTNEW